MAQTETGHHANRSYVDQDGEIHLNGSTLRLDETGTASIASGVIAGNSPNAASVTATADGTGTGTIADGLGSPLFVTVTSANAAHIVVLPTPTVGQIVYLHVGSNGFELRSSTPASIAINGGTGASAESAIPANTLAMLVCTSATTWQGWDLTGTTFAAIEAAA